MRKYTLRWRTLIASRWQYMNCLWKNSFPQFDEFSTGFSTGLCQLWDCPLPIDLPANSVAWWPQFKPHRWRSIPRHQISKLVRPSGSALTWNRAKVRRTPTPVVGISMECLLLSWQTCTPTTLDLSRGQSDNWHNGGCATSWPRAILNSFTKHLQHHDNHIWEQSQGFYQWNLPSGIHRNHLWWTGESIRQTNRIGRW